MTTLAILRSDVSSWLAEDVSTVIDALIRNCEAEIRRKVRVRDMELTTTLDCSNRSTALPDRFLSLRSLSKQHDYDRRLEYMTPEKIREGNGWNDTDGPTAYTIEGDNLILAPAPTTTITLDIVYLRAYAALSADTDTNWVMTNAYDVYLWGTLMQAAIYLEDQELETKYMALFSTTVEALNREQKLSRVGGSSRIRMGVDTP